MDSVRALALRLAFQEMEPLFSSGELILLADNYGYLAFTSKKLHRQFRAKGNGQWQGLDDLFYFTLCFDGEDKETLKAKGIDIELWCYGYSEEREGWEEDLDGTFGVKKIYGKKGFDLVYKKTLLTERAILTRLDEDIRAYQMRLREFLYHDLKNIESVLLG